MPAPSPKLRKLLRQAELVALPTCRVLPTMAVTILVAIQPTAFGTRARWGLALYGLMHMNTVNLWKAYQSYAGVMALSPSRKAHSA